MANFRSLTPMVSDQSRGLQVTLTLGLMHKLRKQVHNMTKSNDKNQMKGAAFEAAPIESKTKPINQLNHNNTSINNQHAICLRVLALSPQSTIDLRHTHGVMMPAARVKELRNKGYNIATMRVTETTPDNIIHKGVAKYVLRHSPAAASDNNSEVKI
jgi:Helix-turn-helix domain